MSSARRSGAIFPASHCNRIVLSTESGFSVLSFYFTSRSHTTLYVDEQYDKMNPAIRELSQMIIGCVIRGRKCMKKIYAWEPWFFLFFGLFHMHRVWALFDRASYAAFWMGIMEDRGTLYFLIMGLLAALCILGIITFVRECRANYIWRWVYVFGGAYLLFDLFAIAAGLESWRKLITAMFDTASPYWNPVWIFFILLGAAVFALGIHLMSVRQKTGKDFVESNSHSCRI